MRKLLFIVSLFVSVFSVSACNSHNDMADLPNDKEENIPPSKEDSIQGGNEEGGEIEIEGLTVINRATEGKGIDIVILGDGFTETDVKNGKWDAALDSVRKYIFLYEPMRSYQHWFNVYAIHTDYDGPDLSQPIAEGDTIRTEMYSYTTRLQSHLSNVTNIFRYAYENSPVKKDKGTPKEMSVVLLINSSQMWGGWCTSEYYVDRPHWGRCMVPYAAFWRTTRGMYAHELFGHGLGRLSDEYVSLGMAEKEFPEGKMGKDFYLIHQAQEKVYRNVTFTTDPSDATLFINRNWAKLVEMNYHGLGKPVEGAVYYGKGVWRATNMSVMRSNDKGVYFNPVQREIVLNEMYKLAGKESEYSLEKFLEYDKRNVEYDKEWIAK